MSLVSVWHNDGSNVSTLEKKIIEIYHVLEDLNYGILRIYEGEGVIGISGSLIWSKTPMKVIFNPCGEFR